MLHGITALLLISSVVSLSAQAGPAPVDCPNGDVNRCNDYFRIGKGTGGVDSAQCVNNKCEVACLPGWKATDAKASCDPEKPDAQGNARRSKERRKCTDNMACWNDFAVGSFSSGVQSAKCENGKCVVKCRNLWTATSVDGFAHKPGEGDYCSNKDAVNICENFFTAEVVDGSLPACNCRAQLISQVDEVTKAETKSCGCPPGQQVKTTTGWRIDATNFNQDPTLERGVCYNGEEMV